MPLFMKDGSQPIRPSIGVKQGYVSLYLAHTPGVGKLMKTFR
ncbi:hypothetical protein [Virgibacillus subterraneus]|nr:hypothetical protein [Virgibacillus subterraneus]